MSPSALSAPSAFGTSPMTSALAASVFGKPAFRQSAFGQTGFGVQQVVLLHSAAKDPREHRLLEPPRSLYLHLVNPVRPRRSLVKPPRLHPHSASQPSRVLCLVSPLRLARQLNPRPPLPNLRRSLHLFLGNHPNRHLFLGSPLNQLSNVTASIGLVAEVMGCLHR